MMGQPQAENARLALARGDCAEAVTAITTVAAPVTANQASANPITLAERMRPSEYTAAVLRVIEQRAGATSFHNAIDIGTGSGVLLAALARCGAHELWGTDIDPDSLIVADALLAREAADKSVHLLLSDVWRDVPPLAFNVIVANLPHFPAELPPSPDRNRSWSGGGRLVLDDFLNGIAGFLASDGVVWMTHHALANLADTQRINHDSDRQIAIELQTNDDTLCLRRRRHQVHAAARNVVDQCRSGCEFQLTSLDGSDIQHVVDDGQEVASRIFEQENAFVLRPGYRSVLGE